MSGSTGANPDWCDPVVVERFVAGRECDPTRELTRAERRRAAPALVARVGFNGAARTLHVSAHMLRALLPETP